MIEFADVVKAVVVLGAIQLAAGGVAFIAFKATATEWHKSNQARFTNIEGALGLRDPDDAAFPRKSEVDQEHERLWQRVDDHDGRIRTLENHQPKR